MFNYLIYKLVDLNLFGKTVGLHEVYFKRSSIYPIWLILTISFLQIICNPMIVLASPRFLILNSSMSRFFNYFNTSRLFDPSIRLSTFTLTIMNSSFYLIVRMHVSVLVEIKPILQKNLVIVLFQCLLACFSSYSLFSISETSSSWLAKYP